MELIVCKRCYRVVGCNNQEMGGGFCETCKEFNLIKRLPCKKFMDATKVWLDFECPDCLTKKLEEDN